MCDDNLQPKQGEIEVFYGGDKWRLWWLDDSTRQGDELPRRQMKEAARATWPH
jgi:hypothetical protein